MIHLLNTCSFTWEQSRQLADLIASYSTVGEESGTGNEAAGKGETSWKDNSGILPNQGTTSPPRKKEGYKGKNKLL